MACTLVWYRDDLRTSDNPALAAAARAGKPVLCVYLLDQESAGHRPLGGATKWWLHHSLTALQADLARLGAKLVFRRGSAARAIPDLAREIGASAVVWNRRYSPAETRTDAAIKAELRTMGLEVKTFNGSLLYEPWEIASQSGEPYKVFTPFWRAVLAKGASRDVIAEPARLSSPKNVRSDALGDFRLLPVKPDWARGFAPEWTPGSRGAAQALTRFFERGLVGYARDRDRPDLTSCSRLSPHLRFGEISPVEIWHSARKLAARSPAVEGDIGKFLAEVGWREFSYQLLYSADDLRTTNIQRRFDAFPWRVDPIALKAWRTGTTGYPMVDAGMRQLWQTGWMHNRVRMVAASFLIKHLLLDWRQGEAWFWDTLVDADPASNPASWQWVAGSGADAAPYFRIFNPVTQGEKFDPEGDYVRRFVPELSKLSNKVLHSPWSASSSELASAGITLGKTYPKPIVEHAFARERALAALQTLKRLV